MTRIILLTRAVKLERPNFLIGTVAEFAEFGVCNGVSRTTLSTERRLLAEIQRKRAEHARLSADIARLERALTNVRRTGVAEDSAARVTSVMRVMIERVVLDRLRRVHPTDVPSDTLWAASQPYGITSRSTFRSYLHRMKDKGLIVSPSPSRWALAPGVSRRLNIPPEIEKELAHITAMMTKAANP